MLYIVAVSEVSSLTSPHYLRFIPINYLTQSFFHECNLFPYANEKNLVSKVALTNEKKNTKMDS